MLSIGRFFSCLYTTIADHQFSSCEEGLRRRVWNVESSGGLKEEPNPRFSFLLSVISYEGLDMSQLDQLDRPTIAHNYMYDERCM